MTTLSEAAKHLAQAKSKPGESNPDGAIETATEPGRRRLSVGYSRFVSIMKFALPATALALASRRCGKHPPCTMPNRAWSGF